MKHTIKLAALGALALAATSTAALAGSELTPGSTTGLPLAVPLPEGVYNVTIAAYVEQQQGGRNEQVGILAPSWLIWSTPWTIAGGRITLDTVTGLIDANANGLPGVGSIHANGGQNTLVDANIRWNFGAFNVGLFGGAWLPNTTAAGLVDRDTTSFQGALALAYMKDGWKAAANLFYGTGGKDNTALDPIYGGHYQYADWFNYDLTFTKQIGRWELGVVANGSTDLQDATYITCTTANFKCKQSQLSVGGLVGYNFGVADLQVKLTRDVAETNYVGPQTSIVSNLIIPLWVAERPLK